LFCKIFFISNNNDRKTLYSTLEEFPNSSQIITTNPQINQEFKNQGKDCKLLSEIFPIAGNKTYEIHRISREILEDYRNKFKNVQFHEIEIFSSIENQILQEIILIEKAREILSKKNDTVLIFDTFSYSYFAILELSLKLGYKKTEQKIFQILGNSIKEIDAYSKIPFLEYKNQYKFLQKISPPQKSDNKKKFKQLQKIKPDQNNNDPTDNELTQEIDSSQHLRLMSEILPLFIKSNLFKIGYNFHIDIKNYLLKKIDKKIQNNSKKVSAKCAFFITSKRDDQLKPLFRVMEEFKNKKTPTQIFTLDLASKKILIRRNIDFINLFEEAYLLAQILKKSNEGKKIIDQIESIGKSNSLSLFSITQFRNYLVNEAFRAVAIMFICEHIFKIIPIESIVVEYGVTRNGNAVLATAKKFGIQSYSIITVLLGLNPILSNFYKSNKLCVYGTLALEQLLSLGYNKDDVIITGNPRYDDLKKQNIENNKQFLEQNYQINKNKKLIVIAMSRWHKDDEQWMSNLIKFCNKNNFEIIIKVHPTYKLTENDLHKNKLQYISKICQKQKFLITLDIELGILLSVADLVITDFSNAGIEAILLEKPLITVNFSKEDYSNVQRYHEYDASIYVDEYDHIEKIIMEILKEKKHIQKLKEGSKKVIDMYNYYHDGNAANRIFNILHNPNKETP